MSDWAYDKAMLKGVPEEQHLRAKVALLCGHTLYEPIHTGQPAIKGQIRLLPDYPNDIAAVFRDLVPAMRKRDLHLALCALDETKGYWEAVFYKLPETTYASSDLEALEDNPARAICLAAIAAMRWDEPVKLESEI